MSFRSRSTPWLLAGALAFVPAAALAASSSDPEHAQNPPGEDLEEYVPGAARLEGRIMAPCCWTQTIDIHGSEVAYDLRREIRTRLKAGETPDAIEASLVKRYGPKILAVPDDSPLSSLATLLSIGFAGAGLGGYFMLRRWSRAGNKSTPKPDKKGEGSGPAPQRDALDERLDRELSEIGDQA